MKLPPMRTQTITCQGGMDFESDPLLLSPGAMILCQNFECKVGGGYRRIGAYERFDGQTAPSEAANEIEARAAITPVPGDGDVLGLWLYQGTVYAFRNDTDGLAAKMYASSATGWVEVNTGAAVLDPGGRYEFKNYNFSGASYTEKMYGVDGVNDFFSFDGTTFTQIPVPGFTTKPKRLAIHKNRAFLAFPDGQLVFSSVGTPDDYDTATGSAGLVATGGDMVGLKTTVGGALAVFMRNRVSILYGSTTDELRAEDLREQSEKAGAIEGTIQEVGDILYLDDRGLTSLSQTDAYGNFQAGTIDDPIRTFLGNRLTRVITSTISRASNQYRLFLESPNGETEVITLTFGDRGIEGFGRTIYPVRVTCAVSEEDATGTERIFVGTDQGFVFELERGNSFDGADIEAYFKLPFHHYGTPDYRKRFRRAVVGIDSTDPITLRIKPEFNYGDPGSASHPLRDEQVAGAGGQWGLDDWNGFVWSKPIMGKAKADIGGSGDNMALLFYHKGAAEPFTIYNVIVHYMVRRMTR